MTKSPINLRDLDALRGVLAVYVWRGARPFGGWLAVTGAVPAVAFGCLCFEICEQHFLHPRLRVSTADA